MIWSWASNTAWRCFALDYTLGCVELISVGSTYGVVTSATDAARFELYSWAAGVGSA